MSTPRSSRWLMLGIVLLAAPCAAQAILVPVEVSHTGNDAVGTSLAFGVREAIRASHGFRLATDVKMPHLRLDIVTVDASTSNPGNSSAIAVTYVYDASDAPLRGLALQTAVHSCGRDRTETCARSIVAEADAAVQRLKKTHYGARLSQQQKP